MQQNKIYPLHYTIVYMFILTYLLDFVEKDYIIRIYNYQFFIHLFTAFIICIVGKCMQKLLT